MKRIINLTAMIMVLCTLFCVFQLPIEAEAASNACALVKGDGNDYNRWITFIVETGKKAAKINFTQTKGYMGYGVQPEGASKTYGAYTIEVINHKTNKTEKVYWKYKSGFTLKLEKNTTYTIKVKAYKPATVAEQQKLKPATSWIESIIGFLFGKKMTVDKTKWFWADAPTWEVKSTSNIKWCHDFG